MNWNGDGKYMVLGGGLLSGQQGNDQVSKICTYLPSEFLFNQTIWRQVCVVN